MATCTVGVSNSQTTNNTPITLATLSPTAGDLIVVAMYFTGNGTITGDTCTSDTGITFTKIRSTRCNGGTDHISLFVADSLYTSGSPTLTCTAISGTCTGSAAQSWYVSGMSKYGSSSVLQDAGHQNIAAGATPAPTFVSSCLTGNPTITFVGSVANPELVVIPTGWTSSSSLTYFMPSATMMSAHRNSGFTGTAVTWNGTLSGAGGAMAIELDTSVPKEYSPNIVRPFALVRANRY